MTHVKQSDYRKGLRKPRRRQPDYVRKAGPHQSKSEYKRERIQQGQDWDNPDDYLEGIMKR